VDDHSRDDTFAIIERLSLVDGRVRGIRLSRNCGSHVAIRCGLHHAQGDAAVVIAADLQDPPELIGRMVDVWRQGAEVVWATRRRHQSVFARLYYWIMRRLVGMKEMPAYGADFFLADRSVLEAFRRFEERGMSVLALIVWLGFRQAHIEYDKEARASGRSGWTLSRKIGLVVDSITAFSDFPIRLCGCAGGLFVAAAILLGAIAAIMLPSSGAGLVVAVAAMVLLTGIQLLAIAIVGEYVWRALEEARRRPQYVIERVAGRHPVMDPAR
jgi:dolichol-phosphate mannosyltransferase